MNLKKANRDRYRQEVEAALRKRSLPTDCQRDEKIVRSVLLVSVCTNGKNGDFVETMDQKTDLTKLWRTIEGIDGRAKREAEN